MALIIFDYDGVLADTLGDMIRFAQETCDELGVQHTVAQEDLSKLEIMSFATYGRQCGVPENKVEDFVRVCTGKFAMKKSPPEIFDGLQEVIRELSEHHVIGIVSGNTKKNVNAFLVTHGLSDCFQFIYGVDEAGSKAEKISRAKNQFAPLEESAVMIGDSVSDIRAAKEAGIKSIAVGWGHQDEKMLLDAKPDYFVHEVNELSEILR